MKHSRQCAFEPAIRFAGCVPSRTEPNFWKQSLLAGCCENCAAKPFRLRQPGFANHPLDALCFLQRQAHRKNHGFASFRQRGPTHFGFHDQSHFCLRKCLAPFWTFVYKSPVSKFETKSCQQNARASLARLARQRRHPAVTGAGMERLAMNATALQGASPSTQSPRSLKIQGTGDFWRGQIKPQILLTGLWLERAGFKPGQRVEVHFTQPGILTVHLVQVAGGAQ